VGRSSPQRLCRVWSISLSSISLSVVYSARSGGRRNTFGRSLDCAGNARESENNTKSVFYKKMLPHPSVLGITYSLKPSTHLTQNKINAKNKIFFAAFTLLYFRCTDVEKMIRALYTVVRVMYTTALQREISLRWQMTTVYQPLNRRANTRRKDRTDRHHTIARHSLLWVLPFTETIPRDKALVGFWRPSPQKLVIPLQIIVLLLQLHPLTASCPGHSTMHAFRLWETEQNNIRST